MLCAVLVLHALPVVAQAPLTISDAAGAALRLHPTQEAAAGAVARAESAEREARAAYLPSLSLDASASRFEEPMVVAPLHGFDPTSPPRFDRSLYQGGVSLSYTLFDGGARGARSGRASDLTDAAEASASAAQSALVAQVSSAYLRVLAARDVVAAHRTRVGAVRSERERAAALFEQGRAPRLALLRAEAALGAAAADTVDATSQLDLAVRTLARLLSADLAAVQSAALSPVRTPDAQPGEEAAVLARALAENPEIRRARAQVSAAERTEREARAQWLPRLQLSSRYAEYASAEGREQGEWQAGVQLGYSLFNGGARVAANERAHAELRVVRAELRAAELRVADAVDAALSGWRAARARVAAVSAALRQSEEVARVERLALDQGAGVQTDYLAAESELLRTRAALTQARYAEVLARVELARLMGELSVSWLRDNLDPER